jgi:uncharacterized protein with NAD-binding domain and iron-sulfur cluster
VNAYPELGLQGPTKHLQSRVLWVHSDHINTSPLPSVDMRSVRLRAKRESNGVSKKQWDDWVPEDRVRKFTDENKELAAQLHTQMKALQRGTKSVTKSSKKPNGSDFSSARGSEERHTSVAATGGRAGQRRNRDYDIETVRIF